MHLHREKYLLNLPNRVQVVLNLQVEWELGA
jgi:hypothetical protein